ncbi:MAG: hypothetical protein GQE15_27425 [Archangiaceae bacterium]|nr:hypothetical protein [Archangiaceae bacterium]
MSRAAAMVALLVGAAVFAQTPAPAFELERLRLNPGARAGLVVDSADLLEPLELRVGLTGHYEHDPLIVVNERTYASPASFEAASAPT